MKWKSSTCSASFVRWKKDHEQEFRNLQCKARQGGKGDGKTVSTSFQDCAKVSILKIGGIMSGGKTKTLLIMKQQLTVFAQKLYDAVVSKKIGMCC
jgi:hypothetical protein